MKTAIAENCKRAHLTRMNMKEDMLTLPKGTIPSKQIMTKSQNRLKSKKAQREIIQGLHSALEKQGHLIEKFDEGLWSSLMQEVVVKAKSDIRFIFKNGFDLLYCRYMT